MAPPADSVLHTLTNTDKDRFLCVFLSMDVTNVDWNKAAKLYGSTSLNGFRVCFNQSNTKVRKGLTEGATATTKKPAENATTSAPSSAPASKGSKARKRKTNEAEEVPVANKRAKGEQNVVSAKPEIDEDATPGPALHASTGINVNAKAMDNPSPIKVESDSSDE
ncbi:MAG: hypothetical protein Q9159_006811 [Coniocarpon cinnabarinum]